jgi:hypothetical protein
MQESSDRMHSNNVAASTSQSTDSLLAELKSYQSSSLQESTKSFSTQV